MFFKSRRKRKVEGWIRDFHIKEAEIHMKTVLRKRVNSIYVV